MDREPGTLAAGSAELAASIDRSGRHPARSAGRRRHDAHRTCRPDRRLQFKMTGYPWPTGRIL
jgi:hypothetical protein